MPLYKSAYVILKDDLQAESEWKPAAWREYQREAELICTDTSTEAGHAGEASVMGDKEILKSKGDCTKFQNDTTFSKFQSCNQSDDDDDMDISKSAAEKCAILHLSKENSFKLLLLAFALENMDTRKKMSDSKLQKCLSDSAKQLKLKEFNYDSNPCVH
jgi:hypothetical protein